MFLYYNLDLICKDGKEKLSVCVCVVFFLSLVLISD